MKQVTVNEPVIRDVTELAYTGRKITSDGQSKIELKDRMIKKVAFGKKKQYCLLQIKSAGKRG